MLPVVHCFKGLWPWLTLPLWVLLASFAAVYSWWFSPLALEALTGNISHLTITHSIRFQLLKTATLESITSPLSDPRLSCPLLLGSPCPLQHLLTLSPGFVNYKVSILTMVYPNFNVCTLLLETQINTNFLKSLKFNKSLSLTSTKAPKGNWDTPLNALISSFLSNLHANTWTTLVKKELSSISLTLCLPHIRGGF